jgi:hypothetical protein
MDLSKYLFFSLVALFAAFLALESTESEVDEIFEENTPYIVGPPGSTHHHSTFLIFINGKLQRLDDAKYYGASSSSHIHDYSFAEIHTHATNITLGFFLNTIGISFNSSCLAVDTAYCNNSTHSLKFFVDGKLNNKFGNQLTANFEHYLITYGDDSQIEIDWQIHQVPDAQASQNPQARQLSDLLRGVDSESL